MNPNVENTHADKYPAAERLVELGLIKDVEGFVARMLSDRHHATLAAGNPDGARVVLEVAHWFADDLAETDPAFDRKAFIDRIMERQP